MNFQEDLVEVGDYFQNLASSVQELMEFSDNIAIKNEHVKKKKSNLIVKNYYKFKSSVCFVDVDVILEDSKMNKFL